MKQSHSIGYPSEPPSGPTQGPKAHSIGRRIAPTAFVISLALSQIFCGGGYAAQLRLVLAASAPFVDSLHLGDKRGAVIADFTDLANGAAHLADDVKICGSSKSCKLDAILVYERLFESVEARGHFGTHARLQTVEGILRGIIAAAKIYYGGATPGAESAQVVTEADLKAKLAELKVAMQP